VLEALHDDGEEKIDVINPSNRPESLSKLGISCSQPSQVCVNVQKKQIWDMVDAFEEELAEGKITLDLFTEVELLLPFQRLKSEIASHSLRLNLPKNGAAGF